MTAVLTLWVLLVLPVFAGIGIGRTAVDLLTYVRRRRAKGAGGLPSACRSRRDTHRSQFPLPWRAVDLWEKHAGHFLRLTKDHDEEATP